MNVTKSETYYSDHLLGIYQVLCGGMMQLIESAAPCDHLCLLVQWTNRVMNYRQWRPVSQSILVSIILTIYELEWRRMRARQVRASVRELTVTCRNHTFAIPLNRVEE